MGDGIPTPQSSLAFFFDKSVGKAVPQALRRVGVNVTIHDEVYDPRGKTLDQEWIRYACERNLIIIKCDKNIRRCPAEKAALIAGNARAFLLGGNANRLEMLRHLLCAWKAIEEVSAVRTPPFVYFVDDLGKLHERFITPIAD